MMSPIFTELLDSEGNPVLVEQSRIALVRYSSKDRSVVCFNEIEEKVLLVGLSVREVGRRLKRSRQASARQGKGPVA